jgi:hypothetical protein
MAADPIGPACLRRDLGIVIEVAGTLSSMNPESPQGSSSINATFARGSVEKKGRNSGCLWGLVETKAELRIARVGHIDEFHLVFVNSFRHIVFEFGACLGQPAVVIAPLLFHTRFVTIGPVGRANASKNAQGITATSLT